MGPRNRLSVLTTILASCIWMTNSANAITPRLLDCSPSSLTKPTEMLCEFDGSDTLDIEAVRQRANDGSLLPPPTLQTGANERSPSAVALLLNSALDTPLFNRSKAALSALLSTDSRHLEIGLWTFATNVKNIAPLGTAPSTLRAALDGQKNKGVTVELLRSVSEIRKQLATAQPRRRLLVIASDGEFDDSAYQPADVVASLKDANIRVVVLFPENGPERITRAQTLRRLADETDGLFLPVANSGSLQLAVKQINAFISSSGSIVVTRQPQDSTLEVVLKNGATLSQRVPSVEVKPDAQSIEHTAQPSQQAGLLDFIKNRPLQSSLIIGAILLITGSAALWFTSVARRARHSDKMEPKNVGDLRPILGWFEFFDGQSTREPIRQSVTRIGRNRDNDLILSNSSVHRSHAVLSRDPSGRFTIVDLDTANGVRVNGTLVKSNELSDGDVVELGEVRMRFRAA
ncbi:MAG: FHA domain-containing protein [Rhodopseudomonas palustris]|nr:MAG: FHA domain-containing protein [Rhodopseudomonas palustris]